MIKKYFHIFTACLFLLLGAIIYSNGLHGPYMGDDHIFFDERMNNIRFLKYEFLPDRAYYRPLANIIPMLCHLTFEDNFFAYHLFNLFLFCLTSFCIYVFIAALFSDALLGFFTGLFYLVHPINGIIVNYITASVFPIQVICMLGALWNLLTSRKSTGLSVLFFALALMCHESAMTLPIYAVCFLVFVQGDSWRNAFKKSACLWILLGVYFLFRLKFASFSANIFGQISHFHIGFAQYLATFAKIVSWYLSKLIFLSGIVLAWSTPVLREGVGLWLLIFCLLLAAFGGAIIYYRRDKPVLLGLLWLLIGFAPVTLSCLSQPTQGFFIEPHWFVFSSIGFFLLLACMIKKIPAPAIKITVLMLLLFIFSAACLNYNYIWSDEERYDLYWKHQAPDYQVPNSFLGRVYFLKGDLKRARYYYQQCIAHTYADHLFYANLGLIDAMDGNLASAKKYYAMALAIEPRMSEVLINLGLMALKENNAGLAQEYFKRAIQVDPVFLSTRQLSPGEENALISLLKIYWEKKDYKEVSGIARTLAAYSHRPITQYNVGIIFNALGLKDEARQAFERAKS